MKKIISALLVVLMAFGLAMLGHASLAPVTLNFSSLEELLAAYQAVKNGTADAELQRMAQLTEFAELGDFFFPTAIPEPYQLYMIRVHRGYISFDFLHEDDLFSEEAALDAIREIRYFSFSMARWDLDYPMDGVLSQHGATERDLIDGIYLLTSTASSVRFIWGTERTFMDLMIPRHMVSDNVAEMVSFLAVDTVCIETGERTPYSPSPPVLPAPPCTRWYTRLPNWLQWIFRWIFFGWIWM